MSEETPGVTYASAPTDEATAQRTRLLPLLAPWLRPAAWAPVVARANLWLCWLIHFGAGLLTAVLCFWLIGAESRASGSEYDPLERFIELWSRYPERLALVTAIMVGGIELCYLVTALALMPWGAGDERLRSSYAHALRHGWLSTTQAVPIVLAVGLLIVCLSGAEYQHRAVHPLPRVSYPDPPTFPANAAPGSQAWKDHRAAVRRYDAEYRAARDLDLRERRAYRAAQPFHVRNAPALIVGACIVAGTWFLWALLRAIGGPRGLAPVLRSPMCEFCGYNLTGTSQDARCPECGVPVAESLGPGVRSGTSIDRQAGSRSWSGWWQCSIDAMLRPRRFGRLIQVNQRSRRYRWCLLVPLAVTFVAAAIAPIMGHWLTMEEQDTLLWDKPELIIAAGSAIGASSAIGLEGVALLVAALVGLALSWQSGRNLLPAAMQMQACLGLFVALWGLFASAWTVLWIGMGSGRVFFRWSQILGIDFRLIVVSAWLLPFATWLVLDGMLVWKGTAAARHANK